MIPSPLCTRRNPSQLLVRSTERSRTTCQIERAATQSIRKCATLDLPAHPVTCWLSEDDWSQLLESRWLTIARNWRQRESVLANQIRQDRRMPLLSCPSPGLFVLLATLSLFQGRLTLAASRRLRAGVYAG